VRCARVFSSKEISSKSGGRYLNRSINLTLNSFPNYAGFT
jgi:hypothetical protein